MSTLRYDNAAIGPGLRRNYITNGSADINTHGWVLYEDAAGTSPVDGTGVAVSNEITWTRSTSSPLRGAGSFLLTKDAANRQGEGVAYAFTIDTTDQGKPFQINFDWTLVSGTFVGSSTPGTNSDVTVWLVDVTNGTVIQPSGYLLEQAVTTNWYRGVASFQAAINSTSYRLCFHVTTTSASAYVLKFDNIFVGDNTAHGVVPKANSITRYTSGSGTYTTPAEVYQIRVQMVGGGGGGGSSGTGSFGAATAGGNTTFASSSLIAGGGGLGAQGYGAVGAANTISIGTTIASAIGGAGGAASYAALANEYYAGGNGGSSYYGGAGQGGTAGDNAGAAGGANTGGGGGGAGLGNDAGGNSGAGGGAGSFLEVIISNPASSYTYAVGAGGNGGTLGTAGAAGGDGAAGCIVITEYYRGTNLQMSNDTDTRVVALITAKTSGSHTSSGSEQDVTWDAASKDTHGAFNNATGIYTIPVSGVYRVHGIITIEANATGYREAKVIKNAATSVFAIQLAPSAAAQSSMPFSVDVNCNAGDTLKMVAYQNSGVNRTYPSGYNFLNIDRLSGPSAIAASETVAARYTSATTNTINNGVTSTIDFSTKDFDSHNAVSIGVGAWSGAGGGNATSNWKFTAPISGTFRVGAKVMLTTGGGWAAAESHALTLYKNNSIYTNLAWSQEQATHTNYVGDNGSTTIRLLAGDYIDVRYTQSSGGNINMHNDGQQNHVSIERIGNY